MLEYRRKRSQRSFLRWGSIRAISLVVHVNQAFSDFLDDRDNTSIVTLKDVVAEGNRLCSWAVKGKVSKSEREAGAIVVERGRTIGVLEVIDHCCSVLVSKSEGLFYFKYEPNSEATGQAG